jgi:phage/plasmid-like protein (TIGR03299 family)
MAHNINTYIGRQAAWHSLGQVTGRYMTWQEILAAGGLDFDVFKSQLKDSLNRPVEAWGVFRWNHQDKIMKNAGAAEFLGTVGKDYRIINHASGFELIDKLMTATDGAHYETAGALGKGEVVWGLADLGLRIHVGEDESKPYLLFATGHDGSMSYQLRTCIERVVCQNTLNVALSENASAQFKIRHTVNAGAKIADAQQALQAFRKDTETVEQKLNFLASRRMTHDSYAAILDRLFPIRKQAKDESKEVHSARRDNILAAISALYESNDNSAFPVQAGTPLCLLNAITNYTDHARTTKGDGRAESALFGSGDRLKTSALELILEESEKLPVSTSYLRSQPGIQVDDFAEIGLNVPEMASRN